MAYPLQRFIVLASIAAGISLLTITQALAASVVIDSIPQGAKFSLEGPNKVHSVTGTTPAVLDSLPPSDFVVHYGDLPGCITPKPQSRYLSDVFLVRFSGRYDCDPKDTTPVAPANTEPDLTGVASVRLSPHQTEILPGDEVTFTLAVHNHSKTTQHNVTAVFQFPLNDMLIEKSLPDGGSVQGDVAVWNIPELFAGQTWTANFPVMIRENTRQGKRMELNARVSGDDIIPAGTTHNLSTTVVIGTPMIPQAGENSSTLFLLLSAFGALALTLNIRRKAQ